MQRTTWFVMVLGGLLVLGAAAAQGAPLRFTVLPEKSQATYISGTQLGAFRGKTTQVHGEAILDLQDVTTMKGSISVDLRTLVSNNASRDRHMKKKLLEVDRFPIARFTVTAFKSTPTPVPQGGQGLLLGTLTLHGVERPVRVPVHFTLHATTLRGEGSFTINLTDFGMTPPRLLGLKVRNQLTVGIRLVAASQ